MMYAELAWVLVSLGTKVQLQIILDPDYLPDYLSVSYDYGKNSYFWIEQINFFLKYGIVSDKYIRYFR